MRTLIEKLKDGRSLLKETYDFTTRYDESGILKTVLRYQPLNEATAKGTLGVVSGTAAEVDIVNRNRRLYSKGVYEKAVERAQPNVKELRNFLGEVDHPWYGSLQGAAFRFTRLEVVGSFVEFEGVILKTEQGTHLKALLDGGVGVQVSTRGYASFKTETMDVGGVPTEVDVVQDDLTFEGIDFVLFASNRGGKTKSESTESPSQETVVLTLEKLRAEHADLVASIEAAAREGMVTKEAQDAAIQAAVDAAIAVEAEKLVALQGTHDGVVAELAAAKESLATAEVKLVAFEEKAAADAVAAAEAEAKSARAAAVEALLKDSPFADLLRDELIACESDEVMTATFERRKTAFESVAARASVKSEPAGAGTAESDGDKPKYTAEQLEQRRLAGLPAPK